MATALSNEEILAEWIGTMSQTDRDNLMTLIQAGQNLSKNANGAIGIAGGTLGFYGVTPVTRAAAITTPNTQTGAYVQADVQSLKTAIDAIRVALTNVGITS